MTKGDYVSSADVKRVLRALYRNGAYVIVPINEDLLDETDPEVGRVALDKEQTQVWWEECSCDFSILMDRDMAKFYGEEMKRMQSNIAERVKAKRKVGVS